MIRHRLNGTRGMLIKTSKITESCLQSEIRELILHSSPVVTLRTERRPMGPGENPTEPQHQQGAACFHVPSEAGDPAARRRAVVLTKPPVWLCSELLEQTPQTSRREHRVSTRTVSLSRLGNFSQSQLQFLFSSLLCMSPQACQVSGYDVSRSMRLTREDTIGGSVWFCLTGTHPLVVLVQQRHSRINARQSHTG